MFFFRRLLILNISHAGMYRQVGRYSLPMLLLRQTNDVVSR